MLKLKVINNNCILITVSLQSYYKYVIYTDILFHNFLCCSRTTLLGPASLWTPMVALTFKNNNARTDSI